MAITFDAASGNGADGADPLTWSHTVTTSESDRILIVGVMTTLNAHSSVVNSVTYGGNNLTKLEDINHVGLWYLTAPPTGANTVSVDFTASQRCAGIALSYTGVHQVTPLDNAVEEQENTSEHGAHDQDVDVTSVANNFVVDVIAITRTGGMSLTENGDGTQRRQESDTASSGARGLMGMADAPGAATVNMNWSLSTHSSISHIGANLRLAEPGRDRLTKYLHNTEMSKKAGRPVILDVLGRDIPLEQLEIDNWMRADGPLFPTSIKYASNIEDPSTFYIESLRLDPRGNVRIETVRESMMESIFRRLGGAAG